MRRSILYQKQEINIQPTKKNVEEAVLWLSNHKENIVSNKSIFGIYAENQPVFLFSQMHLFLTYFHVHVLPFFLWFDISIACRLNVFELKLILNPVNMFQFTRSNDWDCETSIFFFILYCWQNKRESHYFALLFYVNYKINDKESGENWILNSKKYIIFLYLLKLKYFFYTKMKN